jgi:hypothetical protein
MMTTCLRAIVAPICDGATLPQLGRAPSIAMPLEGRLGAALTILMIHFDRMYSCCPNH